MYFNIVSESGAKNLITQVHIQEDGVMLIQKDDTIILDKKQIFELVVELTKELRK